MVLIVPLGVHAQSSLPKNIPEANLPKYHYLKPDSALGLPPKKKKAPKVPARAHQALNNNQKEILRKINNVYKIHIRAVSDEINNKPEAAEKNIMASLRAVHKLLQNDPSIKNNQRFKELYRTVYTEYTSFYGLDETKDHVQGKVFALQKELMSDKNDWMKGQYILPKNITKPKTQVPLTYNKHVDRHIAFFTRHHPKIMKKWLKRSNKYFPMMKKIFRQEGVPPSLVHLSMIESGLNPRARSWASAVGMWQFIRPTASRYGLKINWWVDERRDPVKATYAAARYLKHLHKIWGNWDLAMANYNLSTRGLKRAIREDGGKANYWKAYPYLPRETQGYVPGFIATTLIDRNASAFGFKKNYNVKPYNYEIVKVAPLMPLKKLAKAAGISTKKLKEYNPALLRWATPPGSKYSLKLPPGTKSRFLANYTKIPKDKRSKGIVVHTVHRGETLGYIAGKYGTTVHALFASNKGLTSTIYPGQKIIVPLQPGSSNTMASADPPDNHSTHHHSSGSHKGLAKVYYKVKRGDTIGAIAEWYDVRASQIRRWNHTSNTINIGERLAIYVPRDKKNYYKKVTNFSAAKKRKIEREQHKGVDITKKYLAHSSGSGTVNYVVHSHDTLSGIAKKFGVSVQSIKQANNLGSSRIYKGQHLKIVRGSVNYVVQKHDTLIQIAHAFGVSVRNLKKTNNLNGSRIYEGQHLRINPAN